MRDVSVFCMFICVNVYTCVTLRKRWLFCLHSPVCIRGARAQRSVCPQILLVLALPVRESRDAMRYRQSIRSLHFS